MRSESPEERGQQKVAEPPSYRIENEYNPEAIPQYFQISVGILEGRNFTWINPKSANSYVVVMLGKKKYRTSIRRNKQDPHYREYFAFGMYATVFELQRSSLRLSVMEPRFCAPSHLVGEATIDLGTIWRQPYYQTLRKWVQLSMPQELVAASVGFLKVDISITCRGGVGMVPSVTRDNIFEINYFMEQQNANFSITIHAAFGLLNNPRYQSDKPQHSKPPSTFVRLQFCGLQARTAVQNRSTNPVYSEKLSMVEMFPSHNPVLRFDVCSTDKYACRLFAYTFFNLEQISHDGENGFLPTFGPSLLSLFGPSSTGNLVPREDCPYYRGSLLISLNTTVPYYHQSLRSVNVETVAPISMENLWTLKNFCILCPVFEVSRLDSTMVKDFCGVAITIGEIRTDDDATDEDYTNMAIDVKTRKLYYTGSLDVKRTKSKFGYLDFSNTYPVLQSTTRLPDYRFRMYRNNFIYRIVSALKSNLMHVERQLKISDYTKPKDLLDELHNTLDDIARNILQFLNSNKRYTSENYMTQLDKKQLKLQMEEMNRVREQISRILISNMNVDNSQGDIVRIKSNGATSRKHVKCLLSEARLVARRLEKLIFKETEGWPDIIFWLLHDGSRVGFHKMSASDIIHSNVSEECGTLCGQIQTILFKPLRCPKHVNSLSMGCFCVVGKVELLAWMGLHKQSSAFENCLPTGYNLKVKDDMYVKSDGIMVECRVFIYKAKIFCTSTDSLGHVYLTINSLNAVRNSKVVDQTSTPVWNQLLRFQKTIYTSLDRLLKYPPVVLVEVISTDLQGKTEFIGRFQMKSEVDYRKASSNNVHKLQWYELYKGKENTGKVLMSVKIQQIPGTFTVSAPDAFTAMDIKDFDANTESLPSDLIPKISTYKLDVYFWGLRNVNVTKKPYVVLDIEDVVVKSEVIFAKKSNCNFPNGRVSRTFEASFNDVFSPFVNIKLYDHSTFGRTLYVGTSVVMKPNKFFTHWYPKAERQTSLNRACIMSEDFIKVNQTLVIRKSSSVIDNEEEHCSNSKLNIESANLFCAKRSIWRRLFCKNELEEEELTLLPNISKRSRKKMVNYQQTGKNDWWSRYISSQTNYSDGKGDNTGDKIIIYDSELEAQQQFSKFKDWCATVKLYTGEKTGVREKDEELQCGVLKAGIAIYKWPPPENTIAVSTDGADLNRGVFDDYPLNESAKFLVRVYVIKGINLNIKKVSGISNLYVMISCGNTQLSVKSASTSNTCNPIFGNVYEFRFTLPEEYLLTVSVYHHDTIEADELIGSTTIDLENRIYTKHRARVGLAAEYNLCEPCKWRDCIKPSVILREMCAKNHLAPLCFPNFSTVTFNGIEYRNCEQGNTYNSALECRENICLGILRNWDTLPVCGYPLVPEHVETRTLCHPELPNIEQGKLHMWVDIYPIEAHIPPPVDITPRKTVEYELKLNIFNVKIFKNDNFSASSNLYVRAWPGFVDYMQNTNCGVASSDGYVLNCSMGFSLYYDFAERKFVNKEKHQNIKDIEESVDPQLIVQLMDYDSQSLDDLIGCLALNLNEMPEGSQDPERVVANTDEKKINLFAVNSVRGWWLLKANDDDLNKNAMGSIQLQVSLLPKEKSSSIQFGLETDLQSSSPDTKLRESTSQNSHNNFMNFFYKNNILWGSFIGILIIISTVVAFLCISFITL